LAGTVGEEDGSVFSGKLPLRGRFSPVPGKPEGTFVMRELLGRLPLALALIVLTASVGWGWNLDDLGKLVRAWHQGEDLAVRNREANERSEAKGRVSAAVVAGRLTLAEAAEQFRQIGQFDAPDLDARLLPSPEEAAYRHAVAAARDILRNDTEQLARVLQRLEQERSQLGPRSEPVVTNSDLLAPSVTVP
jgi:hypothetical protein